MAPSEPQANPFWNDAEAFVANAEASCRSVDPTDGQACGRLFSQMLHQLTSFVGAASATLSEDDGESTRVIERCGVAVLSDQAPSADVQPEQANQHPGTNVGSSWIDDDSSSASQLVVSTRIEGATRLAMELQFPQSVAFPMRQPLAHLAEAIIDLLASVHVRQQLSSAREAIRGLSERDDWLDQINREASLRESLYRLSMLVAKKGEFERVSVAISDGSKARLEAVSSCLNFDRRSNQVRLLERLMKRVTAAGAPLFATRHDETPDEPTMQAAIDDYFAVSTCAGIVIEPIRQNDQIVAAIAIESFGSASQLSPDAFDSMRSSVSSAIGITIQRHLGSPAQLAQRLSSANARRTRMRVGLGVLAALGILLCFPVTFWLPVEGRLQPAVMTRVFAPSEAGVVEIHVRNGDSVKQGQPLVELQSDALDLALEERQAKLNTARTQLAALNVGRRQTNRQSQDRSVPSSAEERVLQTQIEGLEKQIEVVVAQRGKLKVVSPIDGIVDRWNLEQSLLSRPLTHGQFIADVYSTTDGWRVEYELPDNQSAYVLGNNDTPRAVEFRMTSGSSRVYRATIDQSDDAAYVNGRGQSVVRLISSIGDASINEVSHEEFRLGATVIAKIDCGKRTLGFVWFRSLIEWSRKQFWW